MTCIELFCAYALFCGVGFFIGNEVGTGNSRWIGAIIGGGVMTVIVLNAIYGAIKVDAQHSHEMQPPETPP